MNAVIQANMKLLQAANKAANTSGLFDPVLQKAATNLQTQATNLQNIKKYGQVRGSVFDNPYFLSHRLLHMM